MDLLGTVQSVAQSQFGGGGQQQGGMKVDLASTISTLASGGNMEQKLNEMGGGGAQGELNEDFLDKGVDAVQQYAMGQGPQDNETAAEQAKDEVISDMVRQKFKETTGMDIPIEDKVQQFGGQNPQQGGQQQQQQGGGGGGLGALAGLASSAFGGQQQQQQQQQQQ